MLTEGIAKLFCEIGYERTSIRDIAKALGVPNSALYYYFQNKQEMLFAVVDDLMERTIRNLEENSEAFPDGENKLALIIESHIRFYVENPYAGKVLMRDFNCLEGGQRDILKNKELKYINCARKVIGEIVERYGSDIDVNVATFSLFGMLNWIYHWYDPHGRVSPEHLAGSFLKIILTGLEGKSSRELHGEGSQGMDR